MAIRDKDEGNQKSAYLEDQCNLYSLSKFQI